MLCYGYVIRHTTEVTCPVSTSSCTVQFFLWACKLVNPWLGVFPLSPQLKIESRNGSKSGSKSRDGEKSVASAQGFSVKRVTAQK